MRISDWSSDVCSSDLGKDKGTVFRGRLLVVALAYLLSGAAWLSLPPISHAQSILSGGRIADIRVEGTQRIEAATVRSYMRVKPGDPFDQMRLADYLNNLIDTRLFADVPLEPDGDNPLTVVSHNPTVNPFAVTCQALIDD